MTKRKLWMDDLEMAIDAYRTFLGVKIAIASNEDSHDYYCPPEAGAFEEALEAFDVIFGEEEDG